MAGLARLRASEQRSGACRAAVAAAQRARTPAWHPASVHRQHPLRQYNHARSGSAVSREPGSQEIERRIKNLVRWNAIAMVLRANKSEPGIGGHISTFASAATFYEVGFNHFFRAGTDGNSDVIYYQGHAAPGIYSRAFLEGRLTENISTISGASWRRAVDCLRTSPVVDARLLGTSHSLNGSRADHGHLPGPLHPLPGRSRAQETVDRQGLGVSRRRRM